MLRHNLLLIYRNFKRFRGTFLINLLGLSAGLTAVLFIYLWVHDEWSMDKFHENDRYLYQVMENQRHDGNIMTTDGSAGLLSGTLSAEMPEVAYSVVVTPLSWFPEFTISSGKEKKISARGPFAGKSYFDIFSYPLVAGNKHQVLADKNSIVISESLAQRLFNTAGNAVGKLIEWQLPDQHGQALITGVFKEVPHNSSYQFDFVLPFAAYREMDPGVADWGNYGCQTFVVLKEGTNINRFNEKIARMVDKRIGMDNYRTLFVKPFSDNYLYGTYENGKPSGGRIVYLRLFSLIAVFVLAIAGINFVNLSTARAVTRMKEIGVKKAMGANRSSLMLQYMGEALILSVLALCIAVLLILLLLPQFNQLTGKQLILQPSLEMCLAFLGITLLTGVIAGGYPALYLSGFHPAAVLKGKINIAAGELWARKGLVIFQFTVSIILIVVVLIVYKQVGFVQSRNIGFNRDHIIYFQKEGPIADNLSSFLAEARDISGVMHASSMEDVIVGTHSTTVGLSWKGKGTDNLVKFENVTVNYDMIETLGIVMKEGRTFSPKFSTDSNAIILNEAAIDVMQLKDPVGQTVNLWGKDRTIIGVTKNFNFMSLHENVQPLFFKLNPRGTTNIMMKIASGNETATLAGIERLYRRFNPGAPFDYRFLDTDYQAQYIAEKRVQSLAGYFAILAIVISCLGLFGLATFTIQRRLKEIGVRKVLGAGMLSLIFLLTKDFTRLVLLAILLALPISYVAGRSWLNSFAFHIPLSAWYFAGAGLIALLTSWITVGMQAVRAAAVSPVHCLRNE